MKGATVLAVCAITCPMFGQEPEAESPQAPEEETSEVSPVDVAEKVTSSTFSEIQARQVGQLPFRTIDFSYPQDKSRHDRMVKLVQQMLDLHKQLAAAKTAHEKTALQRQIDATDRQIDQLVYELYGLTDDEIKIVEEACS